MAFKGKFKFLRTLAFVGLVIYVGYLNIRLTNVEKRFGGTKLLKCSENAVQETMNKQVVRIEGEFDEGSGFPITDHEIFTNFHVIDGEVSPKVVFANGEIETPTKIKGVKEKDMAILTLNKRLDPLPFYGFLGKLNSNPEPTFGEPLYASGFALGSDLKGGVTINRGSYNGKRYDDTIGVNYIQTDATGIQGMSGGPLVNACGQVVGANTMGVAGLSMFIDIISIQNSMGDFSDKDIAKINIDTTSPLGVTNAYYTYISARDLKKAYDLIDTSYLGGKSYEDWVKGYTTTLQVSLIHSEADTKNKNKVLVKFQSQDWINGTIQYKYYEGYWIIGDNLKLKQSNVKEVANPGWDWFYYPD